MTFSPRRPKRAAPNRDITLQNGQSFELKCVLNSGQYFFGVNSGAASLCFNSPCAAGSNKWKLAFALKQCPEKGCEETGCKDLIQVSDLTRDDQDVLNPRAPIALEEKSTVRLCFENRTNYPLHLHQGFNLYAEER